MSFMKPEITYDLFLVIETRDGDTVIPADVVCQLENPDHIDMSEAPAIVAEAWESMLRPYLETSAPIQAVTAKRAWGARLSAPGYMDCTEWSLYETEAEAREAMAEETGDDNGEA